MKKIYTILLVLATSICFGQAKKQNLGLLSFEALNQDHYKEASLLTEKVKELFVKSKRFIPLDRGLYVKTSIFEEKDVQKNIEFINGEVAKQGRLKGAKILVGGILSSLSYTDKDNGTYSCTVSFSISITDIETGELLDTETFKNPLIPVTGIDETMVMVNTVNSLENKINRFIIDHSPFQIPIYSIKKNGNKGEVLFIGGENEGIYKNNRFAIYEVSEPMPGKFLKNEITKITINEIKGDFSFAKVSKKDIDNLIEMYEDPDVVLSCESIPCGMKCSFDFITN